MPVVGSSSFYDGVSGIGIAMSSREGMNEVNHKRERRTTWVQFCRSHGVPLDSAQGDFQDWDHIQGLSHARQVLDPWARATSSRPHPGERRCQI